MLLPLAILLSASLVAADVSAGDGLSYDDLKQLNVSCHPKDSCACRDSDSFKGIFPPNSCSCHPECSSLGTCCIDSPDRGASPSNRECGTVEFPEKPVKSSGYYMVQSCPEDSTWRHLCEGGLDKDGDVLRIAPVTSLDTNTTYRNYYCFRCNELTDDFVHWNLELLATFNSPRPATKDFKVAYNEVEDTWSATALGEDISFGAKLRFVIPAGVMFEAVECNSKVVAGCPDSWEDDTIRRKCDSYTGIVYRKFGLPYKNAHCALCNSLPVDELQCEEPLKIHHVQRVFSFSYLIDVNRSDGDEVAKCADGEKWDPYGKKCRKLSCALPGYVIKDGKCVAP